MECNDECEANQAFKEVIFVVYFIFPFFDPFHLSGLRFTRVKTSLHLWLSRVLRGVGQRGKNGFNSNIKLLSISDFSKYFFLLQESAMYFNLVMDCYEKGDLDKKLRILRKDRKAMPEEVRMMLNS